MARVIAIYDPPEHTQGWAIGKMRVDLIERVKKLARLRNVTTNQLVNEIIEGGLALREGPAKRRAQEAAEAAASRKMIEECNEARRLK